MAENTATVQVRHLGGDRLSIRVRGHELQADQPVEGGGEDTAPTPTELFLGSLSACIAFYAERYLRRHGISTDGLQVACDWSWTKEPLRVGDIRITVQAPGLPPDRRDAFARVIETCPIHNTLRQAPEVQFSIVETPQTNAA